MSSGFMAPKGGRRAGVINPKRNKSNSRRRDMEVGYQLIFHRGSVHQNLVTERILKAQGKAIKPTVTSVALPCVDVVRSKNNPFSEKTVIEHQQSSIEVLKLIIPEDMKDSWPGA